MRERKDVIAALRRLRVQTGSLACLGCGYEQSCGVRGCAILRAVADLLEQDGAGLTPPNEPLTCEGCACEEYRRDTYPCNCCARNDETISDQYRPPEGEADE